MLDRFKKIEEEVNNNPFNKLQINPSKIGIIISGLPFAYVIDYLRENNLESHLSYLKLTTTFPPPKRLIQSLIKNLKAVLIIEELEPFIEEYVQRYAKEVNPELQIIGKEIVPRHGELNPTIIQQIFEEFLKRVQEYENLLDMIIKDKANTVKELKDNENGQDLSLTPRPPVLCAGCPHRATFYALKGAEKRANKNFIYSSDIGCYTLGFYPPLETIHTCLCMGGSIGMANGLSKSNESVPVFAIIGDSTFFHSGIPALANLVYNHSNVHVLILDNLSTAMTGFQGHPGTGIRITGEKTKKIIIEELAKGLGIDFIRVFDPYDLEHAISIILEAINHKNGPSLLIARRDCSLIAFNRSKKNREKTQIYIIDPNLCNNCRICISTFGCPAFFLDLGTNEVKIIENQCLGCGVCAQICPEKAIIEKK